MPRLELEPSSAEIERTLEEWSFESFDRVAFVHRALELLRPEKITVAICEGGRSVRVESGRAWGKGKGQRWALVSVPPGASKRALALALADLRGPRSPAYALDVLMGDLDAAE